MMLEDSLAFSRDPDQLERRARQILNEPHASSKSAAAYDEALRRAQEMLDQQGEEVAGIGEYQNVHNAVTGRPMLKMPLTGSFCRRPKLVASH